MIKLYYSLAPNPASVALFLEEAEPPYEATPVDMRRGDQFKPEFLELHPSAKIPVIMDDGVRGRRCSCVRHSDNNINPLLERGSIELLCIDGSANAHKPSRPNKGEPNVSPPATTFR